MAHLRQRLDHNCSETVTGLPKLIQEATGCRSFGALPPQLDGFAEIGIREGRQDGQETDEKDADAEEQGGIHHYTRIATMRFMITAPASMSTPQTPTMVLPHGSVQSSERYSRL